MLERSGHIDSQFKVGRLTRRVIQVGEIIPFGKPLRLNFGERRGTAPSGLAVAIGPNALLTATYPQGEFLLNSDLPDVSVYTPEDGISLSLGTWGKFHAVSSHPTLTDFEKAFDNAQVDELTGGYRKLQMFAKKLFNLTDQHLSQETLNQIAVECGLLPNTTPSL